jgi:uncharacterized protein (DUF1697 family)
MAVIISLLRGINVGGNHMIKMEALRTLYGSLGLRNPQTYVQSGNVIFKTHKRDLIALRKDIENAIERSFGFRPDVVLRTLSELKEAMAGNPFAARNGIEPSRLLVTFLTGELGKEARNRLSQIQTDPEEMHLGRQEVYIYYPNGMARPKLSWAAVERSLKISGTARNWNSVRKLVEIAERLEAAG